MKFAAIADVDDNRVAPKPCHADGCYSAASFGAIGGDHATEQLRPLDFA